ncbi:unnamed protein product [Rangifer tarandus platyrhynchus]|uniref:Uncharacterized protein n=1 Tax=Rangifer tarandus platyrhynchus TaxID=3082113 RepID=A0AC59YF22_RANTA
MEGGKKIKTLINEGERWPARPPLTSPAVGDPGTRGAVESYAHAPGRARTASEERDGEPGNESEATHAGTAKPTARLDTYRTPRTPGSQQPTRLRSLTGLRNSRPSPEGAYGARARKGRAPHGQARGDWPQLLFPSLLIGPRREAVCAGAGAGACGP